MWFVLAVIFVAIMMVITRNQWNPKGSDILVSELTRNLAKYLVMGLLAAFGLTFLQDSVVVVPAGYRGVIFDRFKGIQSTQLNEGMNFVIPFAQDATLFDVRIQKVEFTATAASKDMQSVHTKVALNFNIVPEQVSSVFKEYGLGYAEKVVHPAVQEAVKAATARYSAEELITKREEVKGQIHDILAKHMGQAHLRLVETYITDFDFSQEFSRAIESKQIAEQQVLKSKRDLERVIIESDQKVAQAKAEAQGLKMQKEAITPQLLELRKIEAQKLAIEKWNGEMPSVMMGDSTPLINLGSLDGRGR